MQSKGLSRVFSNTTARPAGASERPSLLLQQRWDVDVPADGLPVKTAGEQVAHGVVLAPG